MIIFLKLILISLILFSNDGDIGISKSRFVNIVVDAYCLEKFGVERDTSDLQENAIITIYDTGARTVDIMSQLNIDFQILEVLMKLQFCLLLTSIVC